MNVGDRAVWPLVAPCRQTVLGWTGRGRYLYLFFPPAQQRGEGRDDQAERLRRAAILIAPLLTPGPLPVKATRRSFPFPTTTGKHLRGPALTVTLRAGCVTAAWQAGPAEANAARSQPLKRPTTMPGGPKMTHGSSRRALNENQKACRAPAISSADAERNWVVADDR